MIGVSGTAVRISLTVKFPDPDMSNVSKTIRENIFGKEVSLLSANSKCFKDFMLRIANGMRTKLLLFIFKTAKLWSFTNLYGKFDN